MDIVKIIGIGVTALIIIIILKQYKPEFAVYTSIIAGIAMLLLSISRISNVISLLKDISSRASISSGFLGIILKITGIAILTEFAVMQGSVLDGAHIGDIVWPEHCLLVAIQRGTEELIPKGQTVLQMGDIIVTMTDETTAPKVHDRMEELCKEAL